MSAQELADHLKDCRGVGAVLAGDTGVDMTPTVEMLLADGWTYAGTEYVAGKRIRYLNPPTEGDTSMDIDDMPAFGSNEHAEHLTRGRHPGVRDAVLWLTFRHLPPALQEYSSPFYETAETLIDRIPNDSPELTTALNLLVQAKDAAVRAGIKSDQGRAGSVPRPQTVVDPPQFDRSRPIRDTPQA